MEVHFSPEIQTKIDRRAIETGQAAEQYVRGLVEQYFDEDARFRAAVRKGFEQLDRGNFVEEEEMDARVESMLGS